MFIKLLNKEITQFRRSIGNILLMFLFPIVLITILGFALNSMMSGGMEIFKDAKIYYSIEETSQYSDGFNDLINGFKDEFTDITFEETVNSKNAEDDVINNKAIAYITVQKDGYKYFRNPNNEGTPSKIFRSIFEGILNKYTLIDIATSHNPSSIIDVISSETKNVISEESVGNRAVSSVDYYTFAELALIILFISVIVGESVCREKDDGTINRIVISKTHPLIVLLSKISLGILVGIIQIATVYFYSTIVLNAEWGNNLIPMFVNLIALTIFASVLGAFIGSFIKNSKSLNGLLNMIIVFLCLLGGCYTPLSMIKAIPVVGDLTVISPIYWVNSALISLSTGVKDNFTIISLSLTLGLSALMIVFYFVFNNKRRRTS